MDKTPKTRPSLLVRLRAPQDERAWAEFLEIYEPLIYRLARRKGFQDADAAELTQEVFLAVWTHRKRYDPARRFRPWLFGIAINKCRADFRKPVPAPVLDETSPEVLVATGPSPAEAAIAAETASLVAAAVGRLPTGQRTVLVLRIWNGLAYAEIAQTMELRRNVVSVPEEIRLGAKRALDKMLAVV